VLVFWETLLSKIRYGGTDCRLRQRQRQRQKQLQNRDRDKYRDKGDFTNHQIIISQYNFSKNQKNKDFQNYF